MCYANGQSPCTLSLLHDSKTCKCFLQLIEDYVLLLVCIVLRFIKVFCKIIEVRAFLTLLEFEYRALLASLIGKIRIFLICHFKHSYKTYDSKFFSAFPGAV